MKNLLCAFDAVDRVLAFIINPILALISIAIATMLALGIFTRSVLDAPMFGLEELVLMGAMWLYMLGAVLACRDRSHLSADFVEVICSNRKIIDSVHLLATCISLFMAIMFSTWSYELLAWGMEKSQTTPVFKLPWYFSQGSLFVASVLFVFYLSRDLLNDLTQFNKPQHNDNH